MPMVKECSLEALNKNIAELISSGYDKEQAVAIAYSVLRKVCGDKLPEGAKEIVKDVETCADKKQKVGPPPQDAINYFKKKKLKPSFSYTKVWAQENNIAFTVAKMMEKDLLSDVKDSIQKAMEEGRPFKEWAKDIKPTFDKSGWTKYGPQNDNFRMKRIFETNMRTALSAGQWEKIEESKEVLPNLMYVLGPSKVHREEHEKWEGLILPVDDPFWDEHMPPNGFGCKCSVLPLTESGTKKKGGVTKEKPDYSGVQEGFDFNPGKSGARLKNIEKLYEEEE